jgi:serine/threonine protein kinase
MRRRRIGGRYDLHEQLGAASWHATDTELERDVFLRVPAEERVIATLVHPAIVQIFDQGEDNGEPYAVYEYVSGGSLAKRLGLGSLGEAEAQRIAADVTAALAYAHAQGVTHGALGPAAILLDAEGGAKVAGFAGVATPEDDEHALVAVLELLGANTIADGDADATAVLQPVPAAATRRPIALIALAALVLLVAGVGAALLATSGESTPDPPTGSVSLLTSTGSTRGATQAPVVPPPATRSEQTTAQATAPSPTTEPPASTSPPATEPATTAPPTTAPPVTTEPPPASTEPPLTTEPPPASTEPTPTTEPPPSPQP